MNYLTVLIAVCVFAAVYNLIILLASRRERGIVSKRLYGMFENDNPDSARDHVLREKRGNRRHSFTWRFISEKFEAELAAAGTVISSEEYLIIWIAITLLPALAVTFFGGSILTCLALVALGTALPPLTLASKKKKRALLFTAQLRDALLIMSNSLRAGYSLIQAIDGIANDSTKAPLSDEFRLVLRELELGASIDDALKHMAERSSSEDVKLLVSAILISSQVGANMADVFVTVSETVKARIEVKEQIRVLTAQGRLSGFVVGALPLILLILLMLFNPSYISDFVRSPIGIFMLVVSAIMETVGFMIINKIVDVKY